MQKNLKYGILFATSIEAKPFIRNLPIKKIENKPFSIYEGEEIILGISGISKVNAALASSYLIWKYQINSIINLGVSGSTKNEIEIGTIFHIDKVIEPDRPKILTNKNRIIKPDVLKGFNTATLATQDKVVSKKADREKISEYADLVDMEGAAVIQTCSIWGIKSYLFKIVSDTPENENVIEIGNNIKKVREILFDFFNTEILNHDEIKQLQNI